MTGNDNNSNTNEPKEISKERTRQEALVLQDFFRASQRRVEELRQSIGMSSSAAAEQLNLSDAEKKVLNTIHSAGMMEGLVAGVTTFIVLRRFPWYLAKRAAQKQQQQQGRQPPSSSGGGGGYTLDAPSSAAGAGKVNSPFRSHTNNTNTSSSHNHPNLPGAAEPANNYTQNRGGFLWRSFQFTTDLALSFLVAAYTSSYMADTDKIKTSVVEIPLLEGRSALSDQFCPVLVEEYQRQWKLNANTPNVTSNSKHPIPPFDRKDVLKHPNIGLLQAYIEFIENCHKRHAVEQRIRQERGMGPDEPVEIPPPRVSKSEGNEFDGGFGSDGDHEGSA